MNTRGPDEVPGLSIAEAKDADASELARHHSFVDPGYFGWENRTYLPDKSVYVIAREDGRIVGSQELMPYRVDIGGETFLTGRSDRTLVLPHLRGKGVFPRLMERAVALGKGRGMRFVWGSTAATKAFLREGFCSTSGFKGHALKCLDLPATLRYAAKERRKKFKYLALAAVALRPASFSLSRAAAKRYRIAPEPEGEGDLANLMRRVPGAVSDLVTIHQDEAFLCWTGEANPWRSWRRFFLYDGASLQGYFCLETDDRPMATIIDAAAADEDAAKAIADTACAEARRKGCSFVYFHYNARNAALAALARSFSRRGFVSFNAKGNLVVRVLDFPRPEVLGRIENFYITGLWYTCYQSHWGVTRPKA
jgi:GNAT superfamily N-acetyltransferase